MTNVNIPSLEDRGDIEKTMPKTGAGFLWTTTASNFQAALKQNNESIYFNKSGIDLRGSVAGDNLQTIDIASCVLNNDILDLQKSFIAIIKEKINNDIAAFNCLVTKIHKDRKLNGPVKGCCNDFEEIDMEYILRVLLKDIEDEYITLKKIRSRI